MPDADVQRCDGSRPAPEGLTIRREDVADHAAVREVVAAAFPDDPRTPELVTVLRQDSATDDGLSFVSELGGAVVGHVLLSRCWLDAPARLVKGLVLSPLSVGPEWQGQGIGSALLAHALAAAQEAGYPFVVLEGSPLYYTERGFTRGSRCGIEPPSSRVPDPAWLVAILTGYDETMTGQVVYPDAFWRLDAVGVIRDRAGTSDPTADVS